MFLLIVLIFMIYLTLVLFYSLTKIKCQWMKNCSVELVVFVFTETTSFPETSCSRKQNQSHGFVLLKAEKLPQSVSVLVIRGKTRIDAGASSPHSLSLLATGNISFREDQWGRGESGVCSLLLPWTGYFRRLESSERLTPEELELSACPSACLSVCTHRGRLRLQAELERLWVGARTVDVAPRSRGEQKEELSLGFTGLLLDGII